MQMFVSVQNLITRVQKEARKIIHDLHYQNEIKNNYQELEKKLGGVGASEKVAQFLLKDLLINS